MGGLGDLAYYQMDHVASLKTAQGRLWEHLADSVGVIRRYEHLVDTSDPAARKVQRYLDAVRDALASPFEELHRQLSNPDSSFPHKIGKAERILKQCREDYVHKLIVVGMCADLDQMLIPVELGGAPPGYIPTVAAPALAGPSPAEQGGSTVPPSPHTTAALPLPLPLPLPMSGGGGAPSMPRHGYRRQSDDARSWAPSPARWWVLLDHGWSACDSGISAELEGAFLGGSAAVTAVRWARGGCPYELVLDREFGNHAQCNLAFGTRRELRRTTDGNPPAIGPSATAPAATAPAATAPPMPSETAAGLSRPAPFALHLVPAPNPAIAPAPARTVSGADSHIAKVEAELRAPGLSAADRAHKTEILGLLRQSAPAALAPRQQPTSPDPPRVTSDARSQIAQLEAELQRTDLGDADRTEKSMLLSGMQLSLDLR